MKIGVITASDISTSNGYQTRVLSEIEELIKLDVSISVLSFLHIKHWLFNTGGIADYFKRMKYLNCKLAVIPVFPDNQNNFLYRAVDWYQSFFINQFIRRENISLLHCHATYAAYLSAVSTRDLNIPIVYDMHGATVEEQSNKWPANSLPLRRLEILFKEAVCGSDAIISVSQALQNYWKERFPDASPHSYVIPCAVNTKLFMFNQASRRENRAKWGIDEETPFFVYLGSAVFYQKIDKVIEVFIEVRKKIPNAKLLVLCPKNDIPIVEEYFIKYGIDKKSILVFSAKHEEVAPFLSAADFGFLLRDDLVLNNVSSPTKFGEYLSCGVPVIASPGIHDVKSAIEKFEIGFIFDNNFDAMMSFINSVMPNRDVWIEKCRNFAQEYYSWSQYGSSIKGIYELLERNA